MESNKKYFTEKLQWISNLKQDWIGGAREISKKDIDFTSKVIDNLTEEDLMHWSIGPYVNGTIMLSYRNEGNSSAINIGYSSVSGFIEIGEIYETLKKHYTDEEETEIISEVVSFIRKINNYENCMKIDLTEKFKNFHTDNKVFFLFNYNYLFQI